MPKRPQQEWLNGISCGSGVDLQCEYFFFHPRGEGLCVSMFSASGQMIAAWEWLLSDPEQNEMKSIKR